MNIERFTIRDEAQNRVSHPNGEFVRFEDHERALQETASTQPESPGNSGEAGIEKRTAVLALRKLVDAAAPIESGEGGEAEREVFSEAFQDACFELAAQGASSTQPVPGNSGGVEEGPISLAEVRRELGFISDMLQDAADPERACGEAVQYIAKSLDNLASKAGESS
jgi:hypothetical protein